VAEIKRKKEMRKRSAVGGCGCEEKENGKKKRIPWRLFRGALETHQGEITLRQAQLYRYRETDRL